LLDAETLERGDHFTFATDAGSLDCLGTPSGVSGYEDLLATAAPMDLDGLRVLVASIDDLIRMKRAAGTAEGPHRGRGPGRSSRRDGRSRARTEAVLRPVS